MNVNERTNDNPYRDANESVRAAAIKALTDRGIVRPDELVACNTPITVLAWCKWWDGQRNVGKELLAERIRTGTPAPKPPKPDLDREKEYGESIRRWLLEKMPDVCRVNPEVVAGHRRCYGDAEAISLEASAEPHYAAVAAVIRLHWKHGKGSLTVKDHGPQIRAAVREANEQAIADYELIASKREDSTP